jgi:hypothetical protein
MQGAASFRQGRGSDQVLCHPGFAVVANPLPENESTYLAAFFHGVAMISFASCLAAIIISTWSVRKKKQKPPSF